MMNTTVPKISANGLQNGGVLTTTVNQTVVNAVNIPTTPTIKPVDTVLAKNTASKLVNSAARNPTLMNDSNRIEFKSENIQSSIQIVTEDNKKIIISGAKSMNDIPPTLLQQILISMKNVKPNETMLVVNKNENNIQNDEIKSCENLVMNVLQNQLSQSKNFELENVSSNDVQQNETFVTSAVIKSDAIVPKTNNFTKINSNDVKNIDNSISKDLVINSQYVIHINEEKSTESEQGCVRNDTSINMKTVVDNQNNVRNGLESKRNNETYTILQDEVAIDKRSNSNTNDQDERPVPELSAKPILAEALGQTPTIQQRQKKFIYKLKSKNGKMLIYVSDSPIVLKKPIIRLDKMTEADAEKLSKQFAEEKKSKFQRSNQLLNSSVHSNKKDDQDNKIDSTSLNSYRVQTRKRQLKFLPSGRIVKGKKSKMYASSSSLSSLEDDDGKPIITSDEDYQENVNIPIISSDDDKDTTDVSLNLTNSKKVISSKKILQEKSLPFKNKADVRTGSKILDEKLSNSKPSTHVAIQPKKSSNARPVQQKIIVDAPTIFTTLLKVPILAHQLNVRRFKPKSQSSGNSNDSFMFKKIFTPNLKQLITLLKTDPQQNFSFSNPSAQPRKIAPRISFNSTNVQPTLYPHTTIWSPSNILQRPLEPPPLAPLSSPASKSTNKIFRTSTSVNRLLKQPVDIISKFEGFTNTKVVKTKEGPKKAKLKELKKDEEPRTIYDIMEEIFDSMPHWNIHVIPENKSFCLAQISLGRTGTPVLKKSIEINSEFKAKVYVHQLHCRRYDGIYDTESKIRKLIHDVDSVAV